MDYAWNAHGQLSGVTSLAGGFTYEYDPTNPALLAKMTGPVHIAETTYEPHRNLITSMVNRRKSGTGTLPASPDPAVAGGSILDSSATEFSTTSPISSYAYTNDLLGRREAISHGGEAFAMLKLGDTKVDVAYNDRSEVVGATYKAGNETRQ